jgi:hypothetical protein
VRSDYVHIYIFLCAHFVQSTHESKQKAKHEFTPAVVHMQVPTCVRARTRPVQLSVNGAFMLTHGRLVTRIYTRAHTFVQACVDHVVSNCVFCSPTSVACTRMHTVHWQSISFRPMVRARPIYNTCVARAFARAPLYNLLVGEYGVKPEPSMCVCVCVCVQSVWVDRPTLTNLCIRVYIEHCARAFAHRPLCVCNCFPAKHGRVCVFVVWIMFPPHTLTR